MEAMEYSYKITVFTPTYNRAYILDALYRSLRRQTFRDFEWIVLDDGSTDDTGRLVRSWAETETGFPIRYERRPNGGKCRAVNRGLDLARGELFFVMDSDDYLTDDALERAARWADTVADDPAFAGVAGNRGTTETETPNTPLGAPYRDVSPLARYPGYSDIHIDGERAGVWFTAVHRRYRYPEFDGETFLTPAVVWNRMARDGLKVRVFDEIIWVCRYRADGLTAQGSMRFIQNPRGHGLWLREMAEAMGWPRRRVRRMWYTYCCDHMSCEPAYRLTARRCAEYIGAPYAFTLAVAALRRLKGGKPA